MSVDFRRQSGPIRSACSGLAVWSFRDYSRFLHSFSTSVENWQWVAFYRNVKVVYLPLTLFRPKYSGAKRSLPLAKSLITTVSRQGRPAPSDTSLPAIELVLIMNPRMNGRLH